MDFSLAPDQADTRRRIKALIAEVVTPAVITEMHDTGTFDDPTLDQALADGGWLAAAIPGLSRDPIDLYLLFNELEKAGAPYDGVATTAMVAATISHAGSDFLKSTVLPDVVEGRALIALGYSEPDFGSDVAGATTRAVPDGEMWVINGQKMWTTMAHRASYVFLLCRTNSEVPKHKGLTMFVVPMDTPGITIHPVHTMGDERTNATYYDDVRIDDRWRIGDVDGGWRVMTMALAFERGVMGGTAPGVPLLRHMRAWLAEAVDDDGEPFMAGEAVREKLMRVAIDNQVAALITAKAAWIAATGGLPGLEGSMAKLFATERYQKAAGWFQQIAGAEGLLGFGAPGAAAHGWVDADARHCPVTTIYGGTSEIQRNNVAERHLGLPKAR